MHFLEAQEGARIRRTAPAERDQLLRDDIPRWKKVIETAKVELKNGSKSQRKPFKRRARSNG